ncbi:MAG: hypothetical protein H6697_06085 [Myxococcales bacterium]|nr:hypothetical protein [Myxococcales bacterium]MCB9519804.1 hypothetical protein [Myxococcales bacterium]
MTSRRHKPASSPSLRWLIALFCALIVLPAPASAHHTIATSRVEVPTPWSGATPHLTSGRAALSLDLGYGVARRARLLRGTQPYRGLEIGAVTAHTVTFDAGLSLPEARAALSLRLPFGIARVAPTEAPARRSVGVGDVEVAAARELLPRRTASSLVATAALVTPTGAYERGGDLELVDVAPGTDGQLIVSTYQTRASIGAGVWALRAGVAFSGGRAQARLSPRLHASLGVPLSQTPDDIRWGLDADVGAAARLRVAAPFAVELGSTAARHVKDRVPVPATDTQSAADARVGGRTELRLDAAAFVDPEGPLGCYVATSLPVYQRLGGVQLASAPTVLVGCGWTVALHERR